jgi:orotidine-5'-phosphate decarboxylase
MFKIGSQLFTVGGAGFVREVVRAGGRVFLDLKFHDIPNTVAAASREAVRLGVSLFNVHASGGAEMMRKTSESVRELCDRENLHQPKIIGVTVLTSSSQETLFEVGVKDDLNSQVLNLARLTAKCGLDGVVASPLEIGAIRSGVEKKDFLIVTPGIRNAKSEPESQNSNAARAAETYEDQKRVMTAGEAIVAGADFLVIGRPILKANDKISATREILAEIENAKI